MEDHQTTLRIKEAFGESSESENDDEYHFSHETTTTNPNNNNWERIKEINGLWLCSDFISPCQQISLLSAIDNEGWFNEVSHNQAMRFGDLPLWAVELSNSIREVILYSEDNCEALGSDLFWREPLFDQLIVNVYQPGEGICAHVDLMRFEDGIAIVSLDSSCVMHFTHVEEELSHTEIDLITPQTQTKIPVHLTPGSLVVMFGEARYNWKHEINRKPGYQIWKEQEIDQKKRTSITLRKLRKIE